MNSTNFACHDYRLILRNFIKSFPNRQQVIASLCKMIRWKFIHHASTRIPESNLPRNMSRHVQLHISRRWWTNAFVGRQHRVVSANNASLFIEKNYWENPAQKDTATIICFFLHRHLAHISIFVSFIVSVLRIECSTFRSKRRTQSVFDFAYLKLRSFSDNQLLKFISRKKW